MEFVWQAGLPGSYVMYYKFICYIPVFLNRWAAAAVPGPGINCTGPREVRLEFVILVF